MAATGTTLMYISCLQSSINRVIHLLEEEHTNAAAIEHALFRVDCLYEAILRYSDILPQGDLVLDPIREVRELLAVCIDQPLTVTVSSAYHTERLVSVRRGRPRYNVRKVQLELFIERRFTFHST